jgi:hypothetical protein
MQTVIIFLNIIYQQIFVMVKRCVFFELQTQFLHNI